MPSIRSCIATIAVMAMAFSPIAAASTQTGSLVARNANHVARSQVKASAALARRAASNKQKRQRAARVARPASGTTTTTTGSADPYAADSKFLNTKAALAARAVRCVSSAAGNAVCEQTVGASAPANAGAICVSSRCTFRCDAGFAPGGADGTQCVQAASACGGVTCPPVTMGYNTCSAATGQCAAGCFDGNAPRVNSVTGEIKCIDYTSDPTACGTQAAPVVCPAPYSGTGTPTCTRGRCGLACAPNTFPRFSSTGVAYCA